jgi:hypothetical protein
MHDAERNRLSKRVRALVLGARDMSQAGFAAERWEHEPDGRVRRLFETAMVVTYMRPFARSTLLTLSEHVPTDPEGRAVHERVVQLRDEVYAHTDKDADRRVAFGIGSEEEQGSDWMPYGESFTLLPPDFVSDFVDLCHRLEREMMREARKCWVELGRPQDAWF